MPSSWKILICRKQNDLIIRCMIIENYSWVFLSVFLFHFFIASWKRNKISYFSFRRASQFSHRQCEIRREYSWLGVNRDWIRLKCIESMSLSVKVNNHKLSEEIIKTSLKSDKRFFDMKLCLPSRHKKKIEKMLNKTSNFIKIQ